MAHRIRQLGSDRLGIRTGGGTLALFGLPFLAFGVFAVLAFMGLVPVSSRPSSSGGAVGMMLTGVVFAGIGVALVFGRAWTTIDLAQRLVVKQWTLGAPVRTRAWPLSDYSAVVLAFVRGDSDSADRYPVRLKARAGQDLDLCSFTSYAESRECATAVAQHTKFDLEDVSTDHATRASADQADRPFAARTEHEAVVERPASARSEVAYDADRVRIGIPSAPMHPLLFVARLLPTALIAWFVWHFGIFRLYPTSRPAEQIFLGVIGLVAALPALGAINAYLRSRRGSTLVAVSRDGVRITERGAWMTRTIGTVDASDILDIDYSAHTLPAAATAIRVTTTRGTTTRPLDSRLLLALARLVPNRGVILKTRRGFMTFGAGLDDEEIRYLHGIVRRALRNG